MSLRSKIDLSDQFQVGDVIRFEARSRRMPRELIGKYFRVLSVSGGEVKLSLPYDDPDCTQRYHARQPR
jgi:hypothetical protein